jgi:hypothetical protein
MWIKMIKFILTETATKRLLKRWLTACTIAIGMLSAPGESIGQVTITAKDMFSKEGQYYKMYSNFVAHFSESASEEVDVFDYIGEAGEDQVWDFREGPEDETILFDYVKPSAIDTDVEFEGATIVERATYDSTGKQKYLFLNMKPGVGRHVYGFHDESIDEEDPAIPFSGRLLDFPAVIKYGDEWKASASYEYVTRSPILSFESPTKIVYESEMEVDAFGIVMLPGLGFHDCLRINEQVKNVAYVKIPGVADDWQEAVTLFTRNYYWVCKDMGVVVQISSNPENVPPADEFSVASAVWRQFENNHGKSTDTAQPVEGLEISLDPNGTRVLLSWKKADNTLEYLVQFSESLNANSWKDLKSTSGNFALDAISSKKARFYRIVSLE